MYANAVAGWFGGTTAYKAGPPYYQVNLTQKNPFLNINFTFRLS